MSTKISRNPRPRYQPELGVKQDFETLLQKFAEFGTVRYAKFAEVWRDMNMTYFCAGRQTQRECRGFVEEVFALAVPYWLPPSSFLVRAGALYLMYGLYNFQLVIPKVKFRVTAEQWQTILEFQQEARDQQHLDLDYVFQKMVLEKAFCYVATPKEMYPSSKDQNESTYISDNLKEESSTVEDIFSSSALNQLSLVHDQYHKMKAALNSNDTSMPDTSLSIAHRDWIQTLYKTLRTYKEKHTSTGVHSQGLESDGPEAERIEEAASLKKKLKEKAFETSTKSYRTRGSVKHGEQASTEEEESDEDSSVEEKDIVLDKSQIKYHGRGRKKTSKIYEEVEGLDLSTKDVLAGLTEKISMPDFTKLAARVKSASKAAELSEETKPEEGKAPLKGSSKKKLSKKEKTSGLLSENITEQEMADTPPVERKTRRTEESDKITHKKSENEDSDTNEPKENPEPNRKLSKEKRVTNATTSKQHIGSKNEVETTPKSDKNNKQSKQPQSSGKKTKIKSEAVMVKEEPEETQQDGPTAQERLQQKLRERQKQARSKKRPK